MRILMAITLSILAVFTATSSASAQERWIGFIAVKESPLVNAIVRDGGYDPAVYYPTLRQALDSGQVQPAKGRYSYIPYSNGRPSDLPESVYTHSGVMTRWAPAYMVQPGKAMCVQVPSHWPAIAGQTRYPTSGGRTVNCYDFKAGDQNRFKTRSTALMIVVVEPAN